MKIFGCFPIRRPYVYQIIKFWICFGSFFTYFTLAIYKSVSGAKSIQGVTSIPDSRVEKKIVGGHLDEFSDDIRRNWL